MAWADLVAFASSFIDDVTLAELTVDGRTVQVADYRAYTDPDDRPSYTMPENGVLEPAGVAPGTYRFFSDGYWAMLTPLSAGRHTVIIHGRAQGDWGLFETQVTYHLTVK